jgi:DNA polymerase III epsilon subunit-like protein
MEWAGHSLKLSVCLTINILLYLTIMGTYLEPRLLPKLLHSTFIFDFEYIGVDTNIKNCYIWDVGIINLLSGRTLEISVFPNIDVLPPPFSTEFIQVTNELLVERGAVTMDVALLRMVEFVGKHPAVLISHNTFKSDKVLLEIESKRNNIKLPYNWFFFDSLIYCRQMLPKQLSYTLGTVHSDLGLGEIQNQHFALPDAIALRNIILRFDINGLNGPMYPSYSTSLQAIKWLGPSCERAMLSRGVRSVEQLIECITNEYSQFQLEHPPRTLEDITEAYMMNRFQIKQGNAKSITISLLSIWMEGV